MTLSSDLHFIDVAIAHPDPLLAAGVASILQSRADVRIQSAQAPHLDVIVLDYSNGIESPASDAQGHPTGPQAARLVISDRATPWEIRYALEAGVQGYLLPECSGEQLLAAVCSLAGGRRYLCDRVAGRLAQSLAEHSPSPRERVVLGLVADGLPNKEIGRRLGISTGTVKSHLRALFDKLGTTTRTGAVAQARTRGYLVEMN